LLDWRDPTFVGERKRRRRRRIYSYSMIL